MANLLNFNQTRTTTIISRRWWTTIGFENGLQRFFTFIADAATGQATEYVIRSPPLFS